ncbi:Major facilitator superfamily, general substrate transporter [Modestobacter italicus]|uniref:Major facilitator superfamily, general substrate transporter n=1 Tax=Modestobacter italicus (strain DSM 44449 / CECT 9708 / BC 501) TaxID=2732864 RepID=I4ERV8_MODI5|nr:MFS transporter [Modestobacter marinus]CCH86121.1 Major facilitator superfamily, general substrate transporter [Modestobacter marinus]
MASGTATGVRVGAAPRSGLLLAGILLIAANLRAAITSVGPVIEDVRTDLDIGGATASVLISLPLVAFAVVSPVAPALARRIGTERALGAALAVLAVATVVRSLPSTPALWVGTAFLGIAIAVINVLLPSLVKREYPDRIGQVTGLYSSVQGAAAALASGFAVPLAGTTQHGWRLALGIWAGLGLIALAVFLPQLRRRTVPPAATSAAVRHRSPWGSALGWQVTVFMGMQSTIYYTLITWWPSVERAHGVSAAAAGWHLFAMQVAGLLSNLATARLIPRFPDQRWLLLGATGLFATAIAGQLALPGASLLWIVVAGAGGGACIVLALSLFGLRTRDHHQAAALSGMAQSVGYALAAAGPILLGALHDATGSWTAPLVVLLGVLVVQAVAGVQAGRARLL